jgi:hypothetical protein
MVTANMPTRIDTTRTERLLAKLRHRQLELAVRGRIAESARIANRVRRIQIASRS